MLSKAAEKLTSGKQLLLWVLAGCVIGAALPLLVTRFDYLFEINTAEKFITVNAIIIFATVIFFYARYRDFMAPHVLIPVFYGIIVLSTATLQGAVSDHSLKKIYMAVTLGMLFFSLGGVASLFFIRHANRSGGVVNMDLSRFKTLSFGLWALPVLAVLYAFALSGVPLLSSDPQMARFIALEAVGGYVNNLFILIIPASMMLIILLRLGTLSRNTVFFCIGLSLLLFMLIGFRSRILYLLVAVFIAVYYYRYAILGEKIRFAKTFLKGLVVFAVFAVVFALIGYHRLKLSGEVWDYLPADLPIWQLAIFLLLAYLRSLTVVMGRTIELAETEGFLNGQSYIDTLLSPLPGFSPQLLDEFIKEKLFPAGFTGGGSPPMIIGEAYINFGLTGVSITMLICGFVIALLHKNLLKNRTVSGLVLFAYFYQFLLISGIFGGLLLFFQYVLAAAVVLTIVFLSKNRDARI